MEVLYPTIEEAYVAVENALQVIGLQPEHSRNAEDGQWSLFRGEQEIFIDAWDSGEESAWNYYFEEKKVPVIQVIAPVCRIPVFNRDEFMGELLELNLHLFNASFMLKHEEGICCIKQRIALLDKNPINVIQMIESVAYYAEFFGERLRSKYKTEQV